MDTTHGRWIIKQPWMPKEEQRNVANTPEYWTDGRTTKYTELLDWYMVGPKSGSSISITSPILTSVMKLCTDSEIVVKVRSS